MKQYTISVLAVACLVVLSTDTARAQFEGKITYESYQVNADGKKKNPDQFTLFVTPQRILLQGENRYEFVGNIQTEGVLVRLDFEDFVFLTGKDEALKISRADITSMMNMFGGFNQQGQTPPQIDYERTGEVETIAGHKCEKFVFADPENSDEYSEVWMTTDLDIRWGMLAETWGDSRQMFGGDLPLDLIFREGYFPVRADAYRNGELTGRIEATQISESSIARAMVQIPPGVKVLSFQDYLFQKMSRQ
jgi:hypothetical protein